MISPIRALKQGCKRLVEKSLGVQIYRALPRGIDPFNDLERLVPSWKASVIFDVGANVGQSAVAYAKRYPNAKILSFEPAAETFQQLKQSTIPFLNIECFNLAFAAQAGEGSLAYGAHSDMNRIVPNPSRQASLASGMCEQVKVETIDDFCTTQEIAKINYLKIDTEGADLEVLRGAEQILKNFQVDVVEVEAGVGMDNELHVPIQKFRDFLEPLGYQVFGFYEQMHEWKQQLSHLRRVNVVFISKTLD